MNEGDAPHLPPHILAFSLLSVRYKVITLTAQQVAYHLPCTHSGGRRGITASVKCFVIPDTGERQMEDRREEEMKKGELDEGGQ